MAWREDTPQGVMAFCEAEGQPCDSIQDLLAERDRLQRAFGKVPQPMQARIMALIAEEDREDG
jgi:hypothetical protein